MAKKSATYLDYEVVVEDNGAITVRKGGEQISNVMGAIREIASLTGYEINEKHNTRQSGSKLVDFLKTLPAGAAAPAKPAEPTPKLEPPQAPAPAPAPKEEPAPNPTPSAPKAAPATEPAKEQVKTTQTEELTEEEMKQLDDLLKRLEALEARIAKLESGAPAAPKAKSGKLTVVEKYQPASQDGYKFTDTGTLSFDFWFATYETLNSEYNTKRLQSYACVREELLNKDYSSHTLAKSQLDGEEITEVSDGNFYRMWSIGSTLREIKAFATLIGHPIPEKAKADVLAAEIAREHGADGWCFYNGQALNSRGYVCGYAKLSKQELIKYINDAYSKYHNSFIMQRPETSGKSERELVEGYMDMMNNATPRELPANEEIIRQFDEALKNKKMKCKQS